MRYREIILENVNIPVLYHATMKFRLPLIMERGLDPAFSKTREAVYLSDEPEFAHRYTSVAASCILQIDPSFLDERRLKADDYETAEILLREPPSSPYHGMTIDQLPWRASLALSHQVAYYGVIPPVAISLHSCHGVGASTE